MSFSLRWILMGFVAIFLAGCSPKQPSMLEEISGVWRSNDATLVTFIYSDKKMRMLIGEDAMPVSLGDVDNENKTANLNLKLATGKPGVWTVRQVWNKDKTSFNLQITLHDGTQDQLSFVRKISSDDLNKIANAEARSQPAASGALAAAVPAIPAPVPSPVLPPSTNAPVFESVSPVPVVTAAIPPTAPTPLAPVTAPEPLAFSPSFDCAKVSTGPERLICSNQDLAKADVQMALAYKTAASASADKEGIRVAQGKWRKEERDACSDVKCMLNAYQDRIAQLAR